MPPLEMRGLIKRPLFDLIGPDRLPAIRHLRKIPWIRHPSIFGGSIHFSLDDESRLKKVEEGLSAAGFRHFHLERIPPTLEDVYLSLFAEDDRGERR